MTTPALGPSGAYRQLTSEDFEDANSPYRKLLSPFDEARLRGSLIDLTLGDEGANATSGQPLSFREDTPELVQPGDLVNVDTAEVVDLSGDNANVVAVLHAKVSLLDMGFTQLASGTPVAPGFNGRLRVAFVNNSSRQIPLRKGDPICAISFYLLPRRPGRLYDMTRRPQRPQYAPTRELPHPKLSRGREELEQHHRRDIVSLYEVVRSVYLELQDADRATRALVETSVIRRSDAVTLGIGILIFGLLVAAGGLVAAAATLIQVVN